METHFTEPYTLLEIFLRRNEMTKAQALPFQPVVLIGDSEQLSPSLGTLPFTQRHGGRRSAPSLPPSA